MQTYKCNSCGHKFQNKRRIKKAEKNLLRQYVWKRQTYADLAEQHKRSTKWIQRRLDEIVVKPQVRLTPQHIVVVADVTFFSKYSGLCVFREPNLKKNVWWKQTHTENADIYYKGKNYVTQKGCTIVAVVIDGRRGIREVFRDIPVQMCHFHQAQIIERYLTSRPKLRASKELKYLVTTLTHTNEHVFTKELSEWYIKWEVFLKEKTTNPQTGRWCYTHKRTRAAYRSLYTNMPFLFTYQRHPELHIPNTTNSLDGFFNSLKSRLNVHRGLNSKRKMKVVVEILKGRSSPTKLSI